MAVEIQLWCVLSIKKAGTNLFNIKFKTMNKVLNTYHWEKTRKNLWTKVAAQALGYN